MSNLICNSTELDQRFSLPITEVFTCPICCVSSDDLFEQECRAIATRLGVLYFGQNDDTPMCIWGNRLGSGEPIYLSCLLLQLYVYLLEISFELSDIVSVAEVESTSVTAPLQIVEATKNLMFTRTVANGRSENMFVARINRTRHKVLLNLCTEIIHQQSKNARFNSCILNMLNCITNTAHNQIISVDFVCTSGYMIQMFWYKDVLVSHKLYTISKITLLKVVYGTVVLAPMLLNK
ncbi:hypothetical protein EDC94DRAFT_649243 [Helicostylum pulchrum]|nr:hypothetical protein EDC94DRAFT_649243 [Helicostylum pulchrum]